MFLLKFFSKFLLLSLILTISGMAQQIDSEYDFPVKPGMPEWKNFKTHAEKISSLQIPEEILNKMETDALVKTCLNYPMFIEITAYNNRQEGIEIIINEFNGLRELLKRTNAGTILLAHLRELNPLNFTGQFPPFDMKKDMMQTEFLLAQDEVLSNISKEEKTLLLNECITKFEIMLENESYDAFNYDPNTYLIGKILLKEGNNKIEEAITTEIEIDMFLKSGSRASAKVINSIVNIAREQLSGGGN